MARGIVQKLDMEIIRTIRSRDLAEGSCDGVMPYSPECLDELIDLLYEAKAEIEKLQSVKKQ